MNFTIKNQRSDTHEEFSRAKTANLCDHAMTLDVRGRFRRLIVRPLILTLKIDDVSMERLNRWRSEHFPAWRNYLSAHLTLFHAIQRPFEAEARAAVSELAQLTEAFVLKFAELEIRGGFVGVQLEPERLLALKYQLDQRCRPYVLNQDKQKLRPHVTVTNKVTPAEAKVSFAKVQEEFEPWQGRALGFELYEYQGGPWLHLCDYLFRPES